MESTRSAPPCHRIDFGPFSLLPDQRKLLRDGVPVRLGARALDILIALAGRPGELISRNELIAKVWPSTFVDAANLRVHIAALRKALGDRAGQLICTDPGHGYRLSAPVSQITAASTQAAAAATATLPVEVTRLIGRSQYVNELAERLQRHRLITLVGAGGIGKTRVAIACAHAAAHAYRDGAHFVDLTKVAEPGSVAAAIAAAFGLADSAEPLRAVMEHLRDRAMLLVIDNCEHVIDTAAAVVETLSAAAPGVHILATSREALRALGEWVAVLPPLPAPPEGQDVSAAAVLAYPAVELFVERAAAGRFGYQVSDAEAPLIADICRRLEGVALAIELAAAQVNTFGLRWLTTHLDDGLWLHCRGRRTAAPRHQNLAALLDWSYRLLSDQERATFHRIAAVPRGVTLAEAIGMGSDEGVEEIEVIGAVRGLVAKSMATRDACGTAMRYRLAETTRAFAKIAELH